MTSKDSKLTLFRGWPDQGTYTWSPFVTKLEFRFRHAKLAYNVEPGSAKAAPKGKIPYVDLSAFQETRAQGPSLMGDSTFIIQHLISIGQIPDLNESLSNREKLNDLGAKALLEEKLYFYHMRERWLDNFYAQRDKALYSMPYPLRVFVGYLVHRNITSTLHGQGVGRLGTEEVRDLKTEIWRTIDNALEEKSRGAPDVEQPFWVQGGEQPTEADATLFGFIVSVLVSESAPESKKLVKTFPSVIDYAARIHNRFFPDYERWT